MHLDVLVVRRLSTEQRTRVKELRVALRLESYVEYRVIHRTKVVVLRPACIALCRRSRVCWDKLMLKRLALCCSKSSYNKQSVDCSFLIRFRVVLKLKCPDCVVDGAVIWTAFVNLSKCALWVEGFKNLRIHPSIHLSIHPSYASKYGMILTARHVC